MDTMTQPDLDKRFKKLFQAGNLVQVHVSKWGMTVSATEKDLGLDNKPAEGVEQKKLPPFVTLGKKALFTDEVRLVFGRIESNARAFLLNNSHRFPVADAHFVPAKNMEHVITELEKFRVAYLTEVEKFVTNYTVYKQKMLDAYPDFKTLLEPYYPEAQDVRSKFGFTVSIYEIAFPKRMQQISVAEIKAQNIAAEAAKAKYEKLMEGQYHHHLQQMQDFLKETATGMRGEIIKTFEVIAQKIQNREVVSTANLKTLKNTIDSFDALDFLDDKKVKENLALVKKVIGSGADFKSDAEALVRLSTAINTTLTTAKSMTDVDALTGEYTRRLDTEGI
jgi:hypothetical protein